MATPTWSQFLGRVVKEFMTPPAFIQPGKQTQASTDKKKTVKNDDDAPVVQKQFAPVKRPKRVVTTDQNLAKPPVVTSATVVRSATFGIPEEVLESFQIKAYKLEPIGSLVRARTQAGTYLLKRTDLPNDRILFMDQALQFAAQNHFTKAAQFVHTRKGQPFTTHKGINYYCTKWIHGSECDFTSYPQLEEAAKTLAEFHQATGGFSSPKYSPAPAYSIAEQLRARQQNLRKYARLARTGRAPGEIDQWVRTQLSSYREQAKRAVAILELPECQAEMTKQQEQPALCHLNVTSHNLIYTSTHEVELLDFDLMTFGPRVLDIGHLLRRSLQVNNWSKQCAVTQLVAANNLSQLSFEEYLIIQGLLTFPIRLWRVLSNYYDKGVSEGAMEWLNLIEQQEAARESFLSLYSQQVTHYE
ncbi:MAG: hypothetical protein JWN30_265 [Bacilli bacterium]|nr:hypothetical protein [Bacilli bacterium]